MIDNPLHKQSKKSARAFKQDALELGTLWCLFTFENPCVIFGLQ